MIASGQLKAGDRLPPERDLAKSFGVGRSTLREAVRVLESLGVVDVRPGEGTFLTKGDGPHSQAQLPPALFSKWTTQLNLFELRTVLEPGLAGLAARRATSDHLTRMRGVLEVQAARVQRGESGMDEDVTFHGLIAEATGNPALVHLMGTLTKLLQETRDTSLQRDGRPARSLRENRAILAAIEARNPTLAARGMQAHIQSLERTLFVIELPPPEVLQSVHTGDNGAHSQTVVPTVPTSADGVDTCPRDPR
jgi:GntR family transcriptional repressor for pyruvate dehydrogenase complex